jgi:ketopantoate hydroxymethyltransferase
MDQESLAQIQQIVGTATETLRVEIADSKRHTGVLTEGLRHELQLVAEGFQMHLDRRHADDRAYLDEQFRETRALIQLSYGQIQERVERLEQRVHTIEQHLGLIPQ